MMKSRCCYSRSIIMIWPEVLTLTVIGLLSLFADHANATADERCQFPEQWKGKWYQDSLGELTIRERVITRKGVCAEHKRDYYLVRNKELDCYRCLLIMERHQNILQYKESYCVPKDILDNICRQIRVEMPLFTLVRDPAVPVTCPFKDAFYFDYRDHMSGYCGNKLSYAKPCAGYTSYRFHFKHCGNAPFRDSEMDFECIAEWKQLSASYMYGKFKGQDIANKDESYRCFKYEHFVKDINMAMSVSGTCQGLFEPDDGPITMQFSKDIFGWPPPACRFPSWLSEVTWQDFEGKNTLEFSSDSRVMMRYHRRRASGEAVVQAEYRCVELKQDGGRDYGQTTTIFSFTTSGCASKQQCLRFKRSRGGKLEFYQGRMADHNSSRECLKDEEYHDDPQILIEENSRATVCPMQGSYLMEDGASCYQRISIGCLNQTLLTLSAACDNVEADRVVTLQCLRSWQESGRTYLLAKEHNSDSNLVNCFSFRERHNAVHFVTDKKCGGGASGILVKSARHELLERATCEEAVHHDILPVQPLPEVAPSVESTTTSEQEYPDYYPDNLDFHYADENSDVTDSRESRPEVTPASNLPSDDDSNSENIWANWDDRQSDGHQNNGGSENWFSATENDDSDNPYPKYSQAGQSKVGVSTNDVIRNRQPNSSASSHRSSPTLGVVCVVLYIWYSVR